MQDLQFNPARSLEIDIVSDVMCPWCYIGKRRLEKALAALPDIDFDVRWRPFQLDAAIPPEGMDRKEYLKRKFGDSRGGQMYREIVRAGEQEGIAFGFERIARAPNTLDAHRLIRWATTTGHQHVVVEALFSAYFVEGRDIGSRDVLVGIGAAAGMDPELVGRLLEGDADREAVREEVQLAQRMGVSGVPCFILGGRYAVSGAQAPEILADAIRQAMAAPGTSEPAPGPAS